MHEGLVFRDLVNPADEWKWWAMCPVTQQPILAGVASVLAEDEFLNGLGDRCISLSELNALSTAERLEE